MIVESFNQLIETMFAPIEGNISASAPAGLVLLGLITGLRHSMEADHIAAVSTIVSVSKNKLSRAPLIGMMWGAGHTAMLFVAGLIVLLFAVSIPEQISGTLEFGVGVMLVFLGATTLTGFSLGKFLRGMYGRHPHGHVHVHKDMGLEHSHDHDHHHDDHNHGHKSLIVGMVHGLAGSGALMLIILSTINSVPLGLAYIAIFGVGSIASMAGMSALIGLPFAKAKHIKLNLVLRYVAAAITLAIGAGLIYELGVVQKIFI